MARWRYGLPAGLIIIGTLLILLSLRAPAPEASPNTTRVAPLSTIPAHTPAASTQATAAAHETALVATSQQFVIPTATSQDSDSNLPPTVEPRQTLAANTIISPTATPAALPTAVATAVATGGLTPPGPLARFGVSGGMNDATAAALAGLPFGSYMNWNTAVDPARPNGAQFWQTVRVDNNGLRRPSYERLDEVLAAQPGAIWIIGNEPDVIVQDNVGPERYAEIYHELYVYIRERDPSAQIAIAGVAQPTPLRRAYLERVLDHYQATYGAAMPIDIWTVHGFILREEADNWGAGIPPGLAVTQGTLYELADHANIDIFRQNLLDFRAWLASRGYAEHPLAVTEYGVVMPEEYGFPPELVQRFLIDSFDFFLSATGENGWSADGGRLFQYWFWFSLNDPFFTTPNLYDPASNSLTPLGQRYATYVRG